MRPPRRWRGGLLGAIAMLVPCVAAIAEARTVTIGHSVRGRAILSAVARLPVRRGVQLWLYPPSETETLAPMRLILRIRPAVTIWYHQHEDRHGRR